MPIISSIVNTTNTENIMNASINTSYGPNTNYSTNTQINTSTIKIDKFRDGLNNHNPIADDDYTVKISLPSLNALHKEIYTQIQSNVYNIIGETLVNISKDTGMSLSKLEETYLHPLKTIMNTNMQQLEKAPKKIKKPLDSNELCLARTSNGTRCSRKKHGLEFCGNHIKSQTYGRIDQEPIDKTLRKRGRPAKADNNDTIIGIRANENIESTINTINDYTDDSIVITNKPNEETDEIFKVPFEIKEINGTTYIVDENGNIYEPPNILSEVGIEPIVDIEDLVRVGQELTNGTYLWN